MTTRQVPWDKLDTLVPGEHDEYWQLTLRFLNEIVREAWPAILAERGKIEPAARRDLLIAAEAEAARRRTGGPVIAAGSTGSMPATAALIETIAKLPHGAVVLPGLDTDLDEESWDDIAGRRDADGTRDRSRPPSAIRNSPCRRCCARIGIARAEVRAPRRAGGARPRGRGLRSRCGPPTRPTSGATCADRDLPLDDGARSTSR